MENKNIQTWEENIYQIDQMVGDLSNYALLCAMETSKIGGQNRQIAIVSGEIKTFTTHARNLLYTYQKYPEAIISIQPIAIGMDTGEFITDTELKEMEKNPEEKTQKSIKDMNLVEGAKVKTEFPKLMLNLTGNLEAIALKGLLEAYKNDALALMICLEEIRKIVLDIRLILKSGEDNSRLPWQPNHKIEAEKMRTNSKKSEYLSFNVGKNEIIEEFSNITKIYNYKDRHESVANATNGKESHLKLDSDNVAKIDAYLDLYELFNIPRPADLNDMKILILKVPVGDKSGSNKNIAIAVDFVNYPLLTANGDEQVSTNTEIKPEFIRSCWHSSQEKMQSVNEKFSFEKENTELIFLDWQKFFADHESIMFKNSSILVVDDDDEVRENVVKILESAGLIKVTQANSGNSAVDLAANKNFDLIISDLNMPGMDGLETIKKIKELQPTISSMIMTGYGSLDITIKAFAERKIDDFLSKPIDKEDFLKKTKLFLSNKPYQVFYSKDADKQPEFEDLLNLSDLEIQSILKKCELSDLLFALKGCSPSLKHKIEDNLSEKVKLQLKEEFAKTEAVPLAEVEKAQDKIVKLAFDKQ